MADATSGMTAASGVSGRVLAQVLWPVSDAGVGQSGRSVSLAGRTMSPARQVRRAMVLAVGGAVLLTAAAKIQIPFYPVPQTLQTMIVLLLGMALGARLGAAAVVCYLAAGAAGLPVFAGTPEKGIGIAYMIGPTGGYLAGFVPAAAVCGWLAARDWDSKLWKVAAAMCIGNAIIYACGLPYLGAVVGWDKPVLEWGMYNFLLGDLLKIAFAAAALPPLARAVRRRS